MAFWKMLRPWKLDWRSHEALQGQLSKQTHEQKQQQQQQQQQQFKAFALQDANCASSSGVSSSDARGCTMRY
jgi:hypothetical protein